MRGADASWAGSRVGLPWDPGVGAAGKTPEGLRPRLAELPAEPFGTGRGAPPAAAGLEGAGAGRASIGQPHGRGGRSGGSGQGRHGPASRRAPCCDGHDSNPVSSSFTLFCVRRVARAKEKCFHLPCPGSVTAKFCRAVCFNFSGSI